MGQSKNYQTMSKDIKESPQEYIKKMTLIKNLVA